MILTNEGAEIFLGLLPAQLRDQQVPCQLLKKSQLVLPTCPSVDPISFPSFTTLLLPVFLGLSFSIK